MSMSRPWLKGALSLSHARRQLVPMKLALLKKGVDVGRIVEFLSTLAPTCLACDIPTPPPRPLAIFADWHVQHAPTRPRTADVSVIGRTLCPTSCSSCDRLHGAHTAFPCTMHVLNSASQLAKIAMTD